MCWLQNLYIRFLVLSLVIGAFSLIASAQQNCDQYIQPPTGDPLGYQSRDNNDRCEGVYYIQNVSNPMLSVVSFTESFEDYVFNSNNGLELEWTTFDTQPFKTQPLKIQANGLQPPPLYRMDSSRLAGETTYHWPISILKEVEIYSKDLGIIGWIRDDSIKKSGRDISIPLRIGQKEKPKHAGNYRIVLWPGQELTEVYHSLAPDKDYQNFIEKGKPLKYGFYPAKHGIVFFIPKPNAPGIYSLNISANLKSGGSVSIEHWFYHAG